MVLPFLNLLLYKFPFYIEDHLIYSIHSIEFHIMEVITLRHFFREQKYNPKWETYAQVLLNLLFHESIFSHYGNKMQNSLPFWLYCVYHHSIARHLHGCGVPQHIESHCQRNGLKISTISERVHRPGFSVGPHIKTSFHQSQQHNSLPPPPVARPMEPCAALTVPRSDRT